MLRTEGGTTLPGVYADTVGSLLLLQETSGADVPRPEVRVLGTSEKKLELYEC